MHLWSTDGPSFPTALAERRRVGPAALSAFVAMAGLLPATAPAQTFSVSNFTNDTVYTGAGTTGLDFGPTGILYLAEKRGRVLALRPNGQGGYQTAVVFADFRTSVDSAREAGLLGIAVDPDFTTNRYLYVLYTTSTDQRLVRYTSNMAGTSGSSPTVILSGLPRTYTFHKAGDIKFRPGENGNIYIAQGDDGFPDDAQDLTNLRGKMLRVNKTNGDGLATNPYYVSGSLTSTRARIWAIGFRNPFRFTFHPTANTPSSDVMYVSENGDSTDKLAWVRAGSDGAWSLRGDSGGFLNPPDANHKALFTGPPSHIGIAIADSGPFSDGGDPVLYLSNWIFPTGGSILRWTLTSTSLNAVRRIAADNNQAFVRGAFGTHLQFGPDGALYWTQTGNGASSTGFTAGRIRYVGGSAPTASFSTSPSPPSGFAPLTVNFTSTSSDSDGIISSWSWTFGDGNSSTLSNPSHTYQAPGTYAVNLLVTDNSGLTGTTTATVTVLSGFNLTLRGNVYNGAILGNTALTSTTQIRIYEADGTTAIPIPNGLGPSSNGFAVTNGVINATVPVQVAGSTLTVSVGENNANLIPQFLSFPVPSGTSSVTRTVNLRPSSTAVFGRVVDTRGDPAVVDIGVARNSLATLYALSGGRDYLSSSGISASGLAHRVESDINGNYYLPLRQSGTYYLDIVGDTNSSVYVSTLQQISLTANQGASNAITVGLQTGGAGCDDLSAIAATASVDYPTQIQPFWNAACIGCHRPNSANGGYLDLTAVNSYSELVSVASTQVPGRSLVVPFQPANSYLVEKLGCSNPQVGNRMRPGSPMTLPEQALVRDWIAQGAVMTTAPPPDAGVLDTGVDLGVRDTGVDLGIDTGVDLGVRDTGVDLGIDTGTAPDVGLDVGMGVMMDGGVDGGPMPGPDGGPRPDVGPDAGLQPDAGPDGGPRPDVGPDAGLQPDAGPDVGTDSGTGGRPDASLASPDQGVISDAGLIADAGPVGASDAGTTAGPDVLRDEGEGIIASCTCAVENPSKSPPGLSALLLGVFAVLVRRRRNARA